MARRALEDPSARKLLPFAEMFCRGRTAIHLFERVRHRPGSVVSTWANSCPHQHHPVPRHIFRAYASTVAEPFNSKGFDTLARKGQNS
jgi:hypothetical protein